MRLPDDSHRLTILGATGSGKTVAGIWHLSKRNYRRMPWIIMDFKRDKLINRLPYTEIGPPYKLPKKPGLYVVRPHMTEDEAMEDLLWRIRYAGNVGLYVDEGYMLPFDGKSDAFNAILTQGRSLNIPTIVLSQRPVWLSRFVLTEASFLQVFWLNDVRDRKTLTGIMPKEVLDRLPRFNSWYYDVSGDEMVALAPVPNEDQIVASFVGHKEKSRFSFF
jgi:hypothetical protein